MEVMETNYGVKTKSAVTVTTASPVALTSALLGYEPSTRHHSILVHTATTSPFPPASSAKIALEVSANGTNWVEIASLTATSGSTKGLLSTVTGEMHYPYLRLVASGTSGFVVDIVSKHVSLDQKWA
jgi:hypothetical protein